jgi:Domain of unknown function DUF29
MGGPVGQLKVCCKRIPYGEMYPYKDKPMIKYDEDFYGWTQEQAEYLRAGAWSAVDVAHVAEELDTLGRSEQNAVVSYLEVLLRHLLKWTYQPARRGRSWRRSIRVPRQRIARLMRRNPNLRHELPDFVAEAYADARENAADETGLALDTFPEVCPWAIVQVLDKDFWPDVT